MPDIEAGLHRRFVNWWSQPEGIVPDGFLSFFSLFFPFFWGGGGGSSRSRDPDHRLHPRLVPHRSGTLSGTDVRSSRCRWALLSGPKTERTLHCTQTPSTGLRHPSFNVGKRCSECALHHYLTAADHAFCHNDPGTVAPAVLVK